MKSSISCPVKYLADLPSPVNILETPTSIMEKSFYFSRYKESAFVMITCQDSHDMEVVEELERIAAVKEIQHTYGNYDVIIKIEAEDADSLRDVIDLKVRKIEKIRATTTLISSPMLRY